MSISSTSNAAGCCERHGGRVLSDIHPSRVDGALRHPQTAIAIMIQFVLYHYENLRRPLTIKLFTCYYWSRLSNKSLIMAPKRKGDDQSTQSLTGRDKKKQKLASARTIAVQPTPGTSSSSNVRPQNSITGPSKSVRFDGNTFRRLQWLIDSADNC